MPGLFKDKWEGKIIIEVVAIRPKIYAYLTGNGCKHKKVKGTKKCVIKQELCLKIIYIVC